MNTIEVIGGTKEKKELAEKITVWYIKKMMPRMRTLDITIKLTKCKTKDNAYGYCHETDNNRTFEIEIDKDLRMYDFVSTMCHELTHLKQYAKGDMVALEDGRTRWKKVIYSNKVSYANQPWEKEAYRLEEQLAMECFVELL